MRKLKALCGTGVIIKTGRYYKVLNYNRKEDYVEMLLGTKYKHRFYGTQDGSSFNVYFGSIPIDDLNKNIKVL